MKLRFAVFILLTTTLSATLRLDYYYDQSEMYTKFSDWIPKRLHQYNPKNVEDFFLLYSLKQHYGEEELRRNIYFLKIALQKRFRHPSQALTKIETPEQYHKYRLMIFMHINLKIMRSYLRIGSLYDKRHLYFYNLDFADELKKSFAIAEGFYREALPYWAEARRLAQEASKYNFELDLGTLESVRHDIMTGEIDFAKFTANHLARLHQKQTSVDDFLKQMNSGAP